VTNQPLPSPSQQSSVTEWNPHSQYEPYDLDDYASHSTETCTNVDSKLKKPQGEISWMPSGSKKPLLSVNVVTSILPSELPSLSFRIRKLTRKQDIQKRRIEEEPRIPHTPPITESVNYCSIAFKGRCAECQRGSHTGEDESK